MTQLRRRAAADPLPGRVRVLEARLEDFTLGVGFDGILLAYYAFSYLLSRDRRARCLATVARHLRPGGRAVLHLPAAGLLTRTVPAAECAALSFEAALPGGGALRVRQDVQAMAFDRATGIRSIRCRYRLINAVGVRREDFTTMRMAAVADEEVAAECGLRIVDRRTGFRPGVRSDSILELEKS